jgi:tRNA(Ile)-lysidine synthase
MRLARGSGVFGLSAMRRELTVGRITLTRPFLYVPRTRLAATAAAAGLAAFDDPMNLDLRFLRARVRRAMPAIAGAGWNSARLTALAARMREIADGIDLDASHLLSVGVRTDRLGTARLDPAVFLDAPTDVRMRALGRLLMAVGGSDYMPRYKRLAALHEAMRLDPEQGRLKRTLGSVVMERHRGLFVLYRELGRHPTPPVRLTPGMTLRWDSRFDVSVKAAAPRGLTLGALAEGRRQTGAKPDYLPAAAFAAAPAVWSNGQVIAVPGVGWGRIVPVHVAPLLPSRLACPPLFPDFMSGG